MAHAKDPQEQLDRGLVQTSRTLREVFAPALGMVGMSTLSVGAAITATLAATTNFGGEMRRLDLLSKQSTMGVNFTKSLERVAEYYNMTKDAVDASLVAFNSFMTGLRRWTPETAQWFTTQKKPVQDFVEQLRRAHTDQEAFMIAMRASMRAERG